MKLNVEYQLQVDGTWLARVPQLFLVLACGYTAAEALEKAQARAFRHLQRDADKAAQPFADTVIFSAVELPPALVDDRDDETRLQAELQEAFNDPRPSIPHDEAMRMILDALNLD